MLPWGHAAVAYLSWSAYWRSRARGPPTEPAVLALAVGSQFPDLVDKPMAWGLGVLPAGRSLAHSAVVAAVVLAAVWRLGALPTPGSDRATAAGAFAFAYVSHLLADAVGPLLAGRTAELTYLVWPLLPVELHDGGYTVLGMLLSVDPTVDVLVGGTLALVAAAVWVRDGLPGLALLGRRTLLVLPGHRR